MLYGDIMIRQAEKKANNLNSNARYHTIGNSAAGCLDSRLREPGFESYGALPNLGKFFSLYCSLRCINESVYRHIWISVYE